MKDFETRECVVHTHTQRLQKLEKVLSSAFSNISKRLVVTSI